MPTSFQSMRLDISSDFWEAILWDIEPVSENWNQKISRSQKKVCFYRQKNKLLLTKQMHLGIVEVISARQALQFVCLASSPACQICFPNTSNITEALWRRHISVEYLTGQLPASCGCFSQAKEIITSKNLSQVSQWVL